MFFSRAPRPPVFCKAGGLAFALDQIAKADFSRVEELVAVVTLKDGTVATAYDIEALELAMQVKPSAVEGRRLRFARRAWLVHNLLAHPAMQILALMGLRRLAFLVHDRTVPMPLGAKASRAGAGAPKAP